MNGGPLQFVTEGYDDSARHLALRLKSFNITFKQTDDPVLVVNQDGRLWREIGDLYAYESGTRIVARSLRGATDREEVVLLRCAERVLTHGFREPGWTPGTSARTGRQYWVTTIFVPLVDPGHARATHAASDEMLSAQLLLAEAEMALVDTRLADRWIP